MDKMSARTRQNSSTKVQLTLTPSPSKQSGLPTSTSEEGCQNCNQLLATQSQLLATQNELLETIKKLTDRISSLENTVSALSKPSDGVVVDGVDGVDGATLARVKNIEEIIEERTNRQLRKTLVVRGIPETETDKSWQETERLLCDKIAETLDIEPSEAASMIDRCHRGGNPSYYNKANKPRPIFAAMFSWKSCEEIIWKARSNRTMYVDYKYGPITTKRRNLALQKRRELINSGEIVKGHVAYPARLMGKSSKDRKYKMIEDFSKIDVRL